MPHSAWKGVVALLLLGVACGPPTIVEGPRAASTVRPEQAVRLEVRAVDAAATELLAYAWTQEPAQPAGRFDNAAARTPTWLAPAVNKPSTFTLRVTVVDRLGQHTQGTVRVLVTPQRDGPTNSPPTFLQPPGADVQRARAGDTLTLTALARDADGDALTYTWRQLSPPAHPGTFPSGTSGPRVTWASPEVATETDFTFEVSVSDGRGPPLRGSVTVPVRVPRYTEDIQPLFTALCVRCHGPAARLNLEEGRGHADLVGVLAFAGRCKKTLARVQPGAPDLSALILRVSGEDCGLRMPYDAPEYFDEHPGELVRLRSWILGGAPND
jgi:hypothetical protein